MEFKFDGLDKPVELPDKYLTTIQYERMERHLIIAEQENIPEDKRFIRGCITVVLDQPEMLEVFDKLPYHGDNRDVWTAITIQLADLLDNCGTKAPDDITAEDIRGPLVKSPKEKKSPTAAPKKKKAKRKSKELKTA